MKKSPNPAAGLYRLSCIELGSGNPNGAINYIVKAIEAEPKNNNFYIKHVEILASLKLFSEAGDKLYELTALSPRYYSYYRDAIYYKKVAGDFKKGIEIALAWEKQFGFVEEIAMGQIDLYRRNKQNDNVIATYKKLITKYPERRQYSKYLADFYQSIGNTAEADKINREQLLLVSPSLSKIEECKSYIAKGEFNNWLPLAREVINDHTLSFVNQRQVLPDLNLSSLNAPFRDSALELYQLLIKKYPSEISISRELSGYYLKQGLDLKALPLLRSDVVNFPSDLIAWQSYLNCLYRLRMGNDMQKAADSLNQVFPVLAESYIQLVRADLISGAYEKGLEDAESGITYSTLSEDKETLQILMAQCLAYSNQGTEARVVLNTILQENPSCTGAMEALALIESISGNHTEALKWIESAAKLNTGSLQTSINKLEVLINAGQKEAALSLSSRLMNENPNSAALLDLSGDAAFISGDKSKALELWQKASELGLQSPKLKTKIQNKSL